MMYSVNVRQRPYDVGTVSQHSGAETITETFRDHIHLENAMKQMETYILNPITMFLLVIFEFSYIISRRTDTPGCKRVLIS